MICSLWRVLLYQSSHWYAPYPCGISRQWHMGIDLSRLKTCFVIPSRLSEQAISINSIVASYFGIGKMKILTIMRWNIYKVGAQQNVHYITTHLFPWVLRHYNQFDTHCWMGCYTLMLKEAEQFVLSCHNFDCDNNTSGAWVVAWKNKIRMKILDPPALAPSDHCPEWSTELFPTIINENNLLAQKWLSAKIATCSQRCACQS